MPIKGTKAECRTCGSELEFVGYPGFQRAFNGWIHLDPDGPITHTAQPKEQLMDTKPSDSVADIERRTKRAEHLRETIALIAKDPTHFTAMLMKLPAAMNAAEVLLRMWEIKDTPLSERTSMEDDMRPILVEAFRRSGLQIALSVFRDWVIAGLAPIPDESWPSEQGWLHKAVSDLINTACNLYQRRAVFDEDS